MSEVLLGILRMPEHMAMADDMAKHQHFCACREAANEIEYLRDKLAAIKRDVPTLHQRKCHDCNKTHWHADTVGRLVWCQDCESMDTRRVKTC